MAETVMEMEMEMAMVMVMVMEMEMVEFLRYLTSAAHIITQIDGYLADSRRGSEIQSNFQVNRAPPHPIPPHLPALSPLT